MTDNKIRPAKDWKYDELIDTLVRFGQRLDPTYSRMDAEIDYKKNPLLGFAYATREEQLTKN